MYPFDSQNYVNIRMELFKKAVGNQNIPLKDELKASMIKLFEIWDNALLTTKDATVTVWKQGARFYLFYCQPIDEEGRLSNFGEVKAALLTFNLLNGLYEFLVNNFGGSEEDDWFEIRHFDITFVPSKECPAKIETSWLKEIESKEKKGETQKFLQGSLCCCSSNIEQHKQKVI